MTAQLLDFFIHLLLILQGMFNLIAIRNIAFTTRVPFITFFALFLFFAHLKVMLRKSTCI